MLIHPAATEAALAAADRAHLRIARIRDLLTTEEPEGVSRRAVHDALVESILANVAFANAVKGAMRNPAPDSDDVHGLSTMPRMPISFDYAWACKDANE